MNLEDEFRRLGPWVTRFEIGGKHYGGWYHAATDPRLGLFDQHFGAASRLLELGSLEGGHTLALASSHPDRSVLAIEGRADNLARARFVQKALGVQGARFEQADLETADLGAFGRFDAAFVVGLLYHLTRPWELARRLAAVTDGVFLWTHVAERELCREGGYGGKSYAEAGPADPLSGLSPLSFWPTAPELQRMFLDAGFTSFDAIATEPDHPHGPALTSVVRR